MGVEEADERRAVARDVVQDRIRDGFLTEHVRIEPPPEEPVLRRQPGRLCPQRRLDVRKRPATAEISPAGQVDAEHRVDMTVDEPRQDGRVRQLDHSRALTDVRLQGAPAAERHHFTGEDGQALGIRCRRGIGSHRHHHTTEQHEVGGTFGGHRTSAISSRTDSGSAPPIRANTSGLRARRKSAYAEPASSTTGTTARMTALMAGPAAVR